MEDPSSTQPPTGDVQLATMPPPEPSVVEETVKPARKAEGPPEDSTHPKKRQRKVSDIKGRPPKVEACHLRTMSIGDMTIGGKKKNSFGGYYCDVKDPRTSQPLVFIMTHSRMTSFGYCDGTGQYDNGKEWFVYNVPKDWNDQLHKFDEELADFVARTNLLRLPKERLMEKGRGFAKLASPVDEDNPDGDYYPRQVKTQVPKDVIVEEIVKDEETGEEIIKSLPKEEFYKINSAKVRLAVIQAGMLWFKNKDEFGISCKTIRLVIEPGGTTEEIGASFDHLIPQNE